MFVIRMRQVIVDKICKQSNYTVMHSCETVNTSFNRDIRLL